MAEIEKLERIASQIRRDIVRMVTGAQSGHPGGSLGSTDIMTALYFDVMKQDPKTWTRDSKGQDAFVLSAGHMTPVYYSTLSRAGYFPTEELATFRKYGTRLQGHPSIEKGLPGVVQASGSLGQGLAAAAGLAIGKKLDKEDNSVFVLCGDGESEEGEIWEAGMFAAHHGLDNLIAMTDWNGQQIDGPVEKVAGEGDLEAKWKAFGWNVIVSDGNDFKAILEAFSRAKSAKGSGKPTMILFKTSMGKGVDFMEGTNKWHGKAPSQEQCAQAMSQLEETLGDY
jgi:transketolase